ncbi:hypothetical protein [Duganella sp. Root1480D1]|uniref:hypothetical protein n=1 Tax=Duganella sp. Root1480D1 TaxID=1736471 RepID=UPI00138F3614|nr:hypothetical protein [Duganella sp. Root1480D1]
MRVSTCASTAHRRRRTICWRTARWHSAWPKRSACGAWVLPAWQLQPRVAYIVYPGNRHLQTKVRALSDFLAAELPAMF